MLFVDGTIQRKLRGRGAIATSRVGVVTARKGVTLSLLNKDMDDTIEIIKSLENSCVLIDGVSEAVK